MDYEAIAQMTFKKMGCDPKEAIRQDKQIFMGRVYGEATAVKTKEAKNGDLYSYLTGSFRAVTAAGKGFESEKLFLPGTLLERIESSLKAAGGAAVQFGFDVFVNPDRDVSIGYRYAAKMIVKTAESDRLAAITKDLEAIALPGTVPITPVPEPEKSGKKGK